MADYLADLWVYFILLLGIVIVPGMDMMFVLANSLTGGRAAGLSATAGIVAGGACHVIFSGLAVVSLATLVPAIAKPMMLAGAAYMAWIGWSLARSSIVVDRVERAGRRSMAGIFVQGLVTNLLNPKAWLFVLAVLPQFLRPGELPLWVQALVMAAICVAVQGVVYGALGLMAARGRDALLSKPMATIWVGRAAGALLIASAVYVLLQGWPA